jgi:hypothetical protein
MQSIYTFAKIFIDRFLSGMDQEVDAPPESVKREPLRFNN